jgi:DNA-binding transcriptional LysR family regulator
MMDRLQAMSLLVAAVETGSLSAAGRKLSTPLATVSRKIAELEAQLHTRLLLRSTRKLTLTEAGEAYVAACRRILEQVNEAERAAAGEYSAPKGELVLTAPIVLGRLHVLPVISAFLASHPQIRVRLVLSDRIVHLVDDHMDLAVRIGELPDSSLVAIRLGSVRRVVCGSPAFFAAYGTPRTPADLAALDCISFDSEQPTSRWSFAGRGPARAREVAIRARLGVNTAEGAIDAAVAGLGITRVLSYQVARAVAAGDLKIVLAKYEPRPLPVQLVHAGQGLLPRKLQAFLDFAVPRLRARLGREPKAR